MKRLVFIILTAIFIYACDTEDTDFNQGRISFESFRIVDTAGYVSYSSGFTIFDIYFYNNRYRIGEDEETAVEYREGFVAISNQKYDEGRSNEYCVYSTSGAREGTNYAVLTGALDTVAHCRFTSGNHLVKSLMVNNSAKTAESILNGSETSRKFTSGDWFKVIISGYNSNMERTGMTEFYLADYRDGQTYICDEWQTLDLSGFGNINRLEFTFDSSDKTGNRINTPQYVCVDNILYTVIVQ